MDQIWDMVVKICKAIFYVIAAPCIGFITGGFIALDMIRNTFNDEEEPEFTWFNRLKTFLGADDD